jgi:hypothetical protein
MNWMKIGLLTGCAFAGSFAAFAQSPCPEDSLALVVSVMTDAWGYEAYWELLPLEAACGDGDALVWGGNPDVGCGGGVQGLPSDPMPSNTLTSFPTVCVADGDSLVLFHRDSYGDGGSQFSLAIGGYEVAAFQGTGGGNEWSFVAHEPSYYTADFPCLADDIVANGPHWVGSTSESTVSPGEPAPPAWGCGSFGGWCEGGLSHTSWLRWEVPAEGGVFWVSTCNDSTSYDTQLAMYAVGDCQDWSTFELVNANDDIGCNLGAYRSGFHTPCLEGGEVFYFQIDGYYGENGSVEVSIDSANPEDMWYGASVSDLSCSLEQAFNPDGSIGMNLSCGPAGADVTWNGPFGFTSTQTAIGPLLPGTYNVEVSYCGAVSQQSFDVEVPEPLTLNVMLAVDCDVDAMAGSVMVAGGSGAVSATWTVGNQSFEGVTVDALPSGLCEVEVVDEAGCSTSEYVWVSDVGVPDVDLGEELFGCAGESFTLLAPLGAGLNYAWSTGQTGPLITVTPDQAGTLVVGVEVTDEAGCSESDAVILTIDDCASGISNGRWPSSLTEARVFPNPFEGALILDVGAPLLPSRVRVWDVQGREVPTEWASSERGAELRTSLAPGTYYVRVAGMHGALPVVAR